MSDDTLITYGVPNREPTDMVVVNGRAVVVDRPAPPGWKVVPADTDPAGFIYRPDPEHPNYPMNAAIREKPLLDRWLTSDPDISSYIESSKARLQQAVTDLWRFSPFLPEAQQKSELMRVSGLIAGEIETVVARGIGRRDIPRWVAAEYIVRQILPGEVDQELVRTRLSVAVWAQSDGTIVMGFTSATAPHRALWDPLIKSFQKAFDFRRDEGGRPLEGVDDLVPIIREIVENGDRHPKMATVARARYGGDGGPIRPAHTLQRRVKRLKENNVIRDWDDLVRKALAQ